MAADKISLRFAGKILQEEWGDFERRHRAIIEKRIYQRPGRKPSTGTLKRSREYNVKSNESEQNVTASLKHPDYERFIDMRKTYFGNKTTGKLGKIFPQRDVLSRKKGIAIHNRMIWGKLNPVSFRLMNDLRSEVIALAKANWKAKPVQVNI
jgi:hypothetical protein